MRVSGRHGLSRRRALLAALAVATALTASPVPAEDLSIGLPHRYELVPNATGVFVDMAGTVLTARHAIQGCSSLYTLKDGRVVRAELVAVSGDADLALVRSPIKPYLVATFATEAASLGGRPVFAAGYAELRRMKDRAKVLYNGFAVDRPGRPDEMRFMLFSEATHGASGSPVLNGEGLVIGLVARREAAGSGQSAVVAVSGEAIKAFLRHAGAAFQEGDKAETGPLQARAPRAATLSVGIICGE